MSTNAQTQARSPQECRGTNAICEIEMDSHSLKDYWILYDGHHVTITKQRMGEKSTESVTLPRRQFDALIAWYQRPQAVNPNWRDELD